MNVSSLVKRYLEVRAKTEQTCSPLQTEDYVVQPTEDVSPPKWHLGHTTWFFEQFILSDLPSYKVFHENFSFVFNSYYESIGDKVIRANRGNLSRPTTEEVYQYRKFVDSSMEKLLSGKLSEKQQQIVEIGINHEQQHQELLKTDIKYILGHNPLFPIYDKTDEFEAQTQEGFATVKEGLYQVGFSGKGFCYDNELGGHRRFLNGFEIERALVTNWEWLAFINDGGYQNFEHWHAEGWQWVQDNHIKAPLYWHKIKDRWKNYTLGGLQEIIESAPVCHISYYEAEAFASWKNMRLPTEFEWEVTSSEFEWGKRWEWTSSAYEPYPNYQKAPGALGEYNGKFMVNQKVLRGASIATSKEHSRNTYRNFFHPPLRWQYSGLRLVKK